MVSSATRSWAWIRRHPLTADAALAAGLLVAAFVSSNVEIDNRGAVDPSYAPPSTAAVVVGAVARLRGRDLV